MQTKKDHVHAYQTLVGRMSAALLLGDTNYSETPARRALMGLVFGLVLALLVGVGFWVYGLMNPGGNTAWRKPNVIVVEKESGARFVYQRGVLVPVLNHASAMLLLGSDAKVQSVARASLADAPRGPSVGIAGAPDPVPAANALVTTPWLLCLPRTGGPDRQGAGLMSMTLDSVPSVPLGEHEYMWVGAPSGDQYLVWSNRKLKLADRKVAVALGLGTASPPAATNSWLGSLPDGPELKAAQIPDEGRRSVTVAGVARPVGTVFRQPVGTDRQNFMVLRTDGLAAASATEAALLEASSGRAAVELDAASIAAAPRSNDTSLTTRIPDVLTDRSAPTGSKSFCLRQETNGASVFSVAVTAERDDAWTGMDGQVGPYLPPGSGMLAASVPAPTTAGAKPDRFLITDRGFKYALADDQTVSALGFGGVQPRPVPKTVLDEIPSGPALSRAAAGVSEKGRG
ncbi:type VII secretion protein EccB [Lentzea sp. NPDC059081]|uniref:type VII secretion protein EccB n=1 Tax=Lentzea sp. NPDC059081 TaxID=3346719 RepID=UPI0036B399EA